MPQSYKSLLSTIALGNFSKSEVNSENLIECRKNDRKPNSYAVNSVKLIEHST